MRRIYPAVIAIGLTLMGCNNNNNLVEWIESTPASQWQIRQLIVKNRSDISDSAIIVFPDIQQQEIDGLGGCFNELGLEALGVPEVATKEEILKSLFDTITGCRINICRMPIGANDYAVHVQNEPNSCQNFASCIWEPLALAGFIGKYLGPELQKEGIASEIWLGTIERPQRERIDAVLTDLNAKRYISGVGFQWAGKDAMPLVHTKYPEYRLMQTETECGDGSNDREAAEHTFGLMKHYFNYGANAYMYWNMVLNESGKSQWGWKQNSMISINSNTGEVIYNPEYFLMKHFSYFILPGSYKVESSDENYLAFRNHDSLLSNITIPVSQRGKNLLSAA